MHALVPVTGAQDRAGRAPVVATLSGTFRFLSKHHADGGCQRPEFRRAVRTVLGRVDVEIVERSDRTTGFVVLPERRIVVRIFAWLGRCRRLAEDWEIIDRMALASLRLASIGFMLGKRCNSARCFRKDSKRRWIRRYRS